MRVKALVLTTFAVIFVLDGCSSTSQVEGPPPPGVMYVQVRNPERELCTDDTLSPTEWINVPLARFAHGSLELNGRNVSEQGLMDWAEKYYRAKAERGLWVEISPEANVNAEHALLPLLHLYPDLQLRRVEFGFTCPKLQK